MRAVPVAVRVAYMVPALCLSLTWETSSLVVLLSAQDAAAAGVGTRQGSSRTLCVNGAPGVVRAGKAPVCVCAACLVL
jgi:hypothetical protein